jgi:hypothetical protein
VQNDRRPWTDDRSHDHLASVIRPRSFVFSIPQDLQPLIALVPAVAGEPQQKEK